VCAAGAKSGRTMPAPSKDMPKAAERILATASDLF
jgi:hypothetical protein